MNDSVVGYNNVYLHKKKNSHYRCSETIVKWVMIQVVLVKLLDSQELCRRPGCLKFNKDIIQDFMSTDVPCCRALLRVYCMCKTSLHVFGLTVLSVLFA